MSEMIKLALWKNDRRTKPTQPPLKAGTPVEIDGKKYWLSAYINGPKDDHAIKEGIEKFIDFLSAENGKFPIVSLGLTPVEGGYQGGSGNAPAPQYDDNIPF